MPLWAGIDEAGYGPPLGPLVVAGTAFQVSGPPREGLMWELLGDAVCRRRRGSGGRMVVNDSKQVYTPARGLKLLEEGVLGFLATCTQGRVARANDLLAALEAGRGETAVDAPWFAPARRLELPVATNLSALRSKAHLLRRALRSADARMVGARAAVVMPEEFNRVVSRTHNKSLLLFQKCGLLLQELWKHAGPGRSHIVVDRHGGRRRYRRLLGDVFPGCSCDVVGEEATRSTYRIAEGDRTLILTFLKEGDLEALPTSLASMTAKYVRELYMLAFNRYWQSRLNGLRATAGYGRDARRFLRDIAPVMRDEGVDSSRLVRSR